MSEKHFMHSQVRLGAGAEGEEQRFASLMPLPTWSQAKDTHVLLARVLLMLGFPAWLRQKA